PRRRGGLRGLVTKARWCSRAALAGIGARVPRGSRTDRAVRDCHSVAVEAKTRPAILQQRRSCRLPALPREILRNWLRVSRLLMSAERTPSNMPGMRHDRLPDGFGVRIDPRVRAYSGGRILIGGTPARLLRLAPEAAEMIGDGYLEVNGPKSAVVA